MYESLDNSSDQVKDIIKTDQASCKSSTSCAQSSSKEEHAFEEIMYIEQISSIKVQQIVVVPLTYPNKYFPLGLKNEVDV